MIINNYDYSKEYKLYNQRCIENYSFLEKVSPILELLIKEGVIEGNIGSDDFELFNIDNIEYHNFIQNDKDLSYFEAQCFCDFPDSYDHGLYFKGEATVRLPNDFFTNIQDYIDGVNKKIEEHKRNELIRENDYKINNYLKLKEELESKGLI